MNGTIPPELGNLSRVNWLNLEQNHLAGKLPDSLTELSALREFRFGENTGLCAPPALQSWLEQLYRYSGQRCPEETSAATDRVVLVNLYRTTLGPEWVNSENWLTDAPLDEWFGVETDDSGRVTVLRLESNGLTGIIPSELELLDALTALSLVNNYMIGDIPTELSNLEQLSILNLGYNDLIGPIPPSLGQLSNLTELGLYGNELTGSIPPELGNLYWLQTLELFLNSLTGSIPPELGNLSRLAKLDLGRNNLSGPFPAELARLPNLDFLVISNNQLTGRLPAGLANLSKMAFLEFSYNDGLCAPAALQDWLAGIEVRHGPLC